MKRKRGNRKIRERRNGRAVLSSVLGGGMARLALEEDKTEREREIEKYRKRERERGGGVEKNR